MTPMCLLGRRCVGEQRWSSVGCRTVVAMSRWIVPV